MTIITPAEDIDVAVCVDGSTIDVSVEGGVQSVNVPWDGNSFANASFTSFVQGEAFPAMTISGALVSITSMEITITVENSGSTKFTIPFLAETC